MEMRLLAVADIYDALTASRPYREAMPHEKALSLLKKEAGVALDADCVAAVERLSAPQALARAA
ncbi:HD domain-containing phosphohydrolase [Armatimonas sp.]|uniref:HD domain-containing phosphohydrolase n=1 Tax=Armatimonas sp. TaxID=1872638 RepID=UPI0037504F05